MTVGAGRARLHAADPIAAAAIAATSSAKEREGREDRKEQLAFADLAVFAFLRFVGASHLTAELPLDSLKGARVGSFLLET